MCDLCRTNTLQKNPQHSAPTNEPTHHQQRSIIMNSTNTIVLPVRTLTIADAAPTLALGTIDAAAISSIIKPRNSTINPGTYTIDSTFRVAARVTKNPDETEVRALGVDYTMLALLLANHVNRTTLVSVLTEMIDHHTNNTKPSTEQTKEMVAQLWEAFKVFTTGSRSGKTLVDGEVVRIG